MVGLLISSKLKSDETEKYDISVLGENFISFKYILFVGSVKPHKNIKNALLGFSLMKNKAYKFVIVGKKKALLQGIRRSLAL